MSCLRGYLLVRTLYIIYSSISQAFHPKACTRSAVKEIPPFFYRWSFVSPVFYKITKLIPIFVIGLHKLYIEEKLIHRDISIGNLEYEEVDRTPRIINLDLDLSTRIEYAARTVEVRTGTAPLMARDVLKGFKSGYRHTLNHDLESVYYISGWHIAGYRGYELPIIDNVRSDPFRDWKYGTYQEMCQAKEDHVNTRPSHNIFGKYQDPDDKSDAIDTLNIIRSYYLNRHKIVGSLDHDLDEFKEIHAAGRQADKYGLRGKERNEFVQKKYGNSEKRMSVKKSQMLFHSGNG